MKLLIPLLILMILSTKLCSQSEDGLLPPNYVNSYIGGSLGMGYSFNNHFLFKKKELLPEINLDDKINVVLNFDILYEYLSSSNLSWTFDINFCSWNYNFIENIFIPALKNDIDTIIIPSSFNFQPVINEFRFLILGNSLIYDNDFHKGRLNKPNHFLRGFTLIWGASLRSLFFQKDNATINMNTIDDKLKYLTSNDYKLSNDSKTIFTDYYKQNNFNYCMNLILGIGYHIGLKNILYNISEYESKSNLQDIILYPQLLLNYEILNSNNIDFEKVYNIDIKINIKFPLNLLYNLDYMYDD